MTLEARAGSVAAIRRHPLKSAQGEALVRAEIGERGIPGDRAWALIDRETGRVASAKLPRLWASVLGMRPAFVAEPAPGEPTPPLRIALADGRTVLTGEPGTDEAVSAAVGRPVTLSATPPAEPTIEKEFPDLDGLGVRDVVLAGRIAERAAGTFFDYAPIHLLTTAALATLEAAHPDGAFDPRRFRPNLVVATPSGVAGFPENAWVGRVLAIGDVRLRIVAPTPRCVVTTLPQPGLPRDVGILRTVADRNRLAFPGESGPPLASVGVYAVVERGGRVAVGADVHLEAEAGRR
jgi:uncharacterized protein YcbX